MHCTVKEFWKTLHDKTNKMTCAPSKDSDQPGHQSSLYAQTQCSSTGQRRLIILGGCPGLSESSLGAHHFVGFVMLRLDFEDTSTQTPSWHVTWLKNNKSPSFKIKNILNYFPYISYFCKDMNCQDGACQCFGWACTCTWMCSQQQTFLRKPSTSSLRSANIGKFILFLPVARIRYIIIWDFSNFLSSQHALADFKQKDFKSLPFVSFSFNTWLLLSN